MSKKAPACFAKSSTRFQPPKKRNRFQRVCTRSQHWTWTLLTASLATTVDNTIKMADTGQKHGCQWCIRSIDWSSWHYFTPVNEKRVCVDEHGVRACVRACVCHGVCVCVCVCVCLLQCYASLKAGPPLDLSFWSFLTFLHHGIEEVERHLLWKFYKIIRRKSWPNVPPKLVACIGFLHKVVHKIGRLRKFNRSLGI